MAESATVMKVAPGAGQDEGGKGKKLETGPESLEGVEG